MNRPFPAFRIILFSAFLAVLTLSCKKEPTGDGSYKGKVIDFYSRKPVPNARVILFSKEANAELSFYRQDMATFADSNGNFLIKLIESPDRSYIIRAYKPFYDEYSSEYTVKDGFFTVTLKPFGYIHYFVKYTHPAQFAGINTSGGGVEVRAPRDSDFVDVSIGNEFLNIGCFISIQNVISSYPDKIFVPAFDTVEYRINY